jgi:putative transposase
MLIRSSIPIKLKVNDLIVRTIELYKQGLQICVDKAWGMQIINNIKLHPFVYQDLRTLGLPSQLSVACIKQACGMVKKAKSKPFINRVSVRYNQPRSFSFKNNILSISTIQGRVKIPIQIPDYALKYFDWKITESLLTQRKEKYYFTFTFSRESPINPNQHSRILGVDLGVNKLAVTSDNRFYGKDIKKLRIKHDKLISILQAKGTKSAKRKLKKLSGGWRRFMAWSNHNISKEIIESLNTGDVVVMEDLKGIRETAKYNKWVHKWAFYQLQKFVEYKALAKGIRVVYVNPKYTSKTCSVCGSTDTKRHSGFFECLCCGFHCDCDLQASRNISKRYTRNLGLGFITNPHISTDEHESSSRAIECEVRDKYPAL